MPLLERALAIREKVLGPEHPWTVAVAYQADDKKYYARMSIALADTQRIDRFVNVADSVGAARF